MVQSTSGDSAGKAAVIMLTDRNGIFYCWVLMEMWEKTVEIPLFVPFLLFSPSVNLYL